MAAVAEADVAQLHLDVEQLGSSCGRAAAAAGGGLAEEVLHGDGTVDEREVRIEEECLKMLALHQPVAIDLRYLVAILKVDKELERMGDLAVNIAARVGGCWSTNRSGCRRSS
ncbi:MAG: hypothetical protein FJ265_07410 [Planctomycetes bacterium]|nr:hypothetical protein [Planctomycetota bacterium]